MQLPFTTEQFLQVFEKYNNGVFPIQIIFYGLALLMIFYVIVGDAAKSKKILFILAFMWLWMGIVYHSIYFSEINKAAYIFGLLFVIQGGLFLYHWFKGEILFENKNDIYSVTGWAFITYGLLIYPVFGYLIGHHYPSAPILGAPCPTAIFTFGILLFSNKLPKILIVLPVLWAIIGFTAATRLGIIQDYGLLISGVIAFVLIIHRDKGSKKILWHA